MIYFMLHGFASATPNESSTFFEDNVLKEDDKLYNLNYRFNEFAAEDLFEAVDEILCEFTLGNRDEVTFVGCSLGGYMAQHMAGAYLGKAIVINPALIPAESLMRFLGENTNYRTAETFNMTEKDVAGFANFYVTPGIVPTLLLLDMGDDVLDASKAVEHFAGKADIRTYEGGSHRFDHLPEALVAIKEFANTLV
jgi:predicted esterase YcpF (UPF0227 family)